MTSESNMTCQILDAYNMVTFSYTDLISFKQIKNENQLTNGEN